MFCTKFEGKQALYLLCKLASFLLGSNPNQKIYLQLGKNFKKTVYGLRLNEAKLTSRNGFTNNPSALKHVKESEND